MNEPDDFDNAAPKSKSQRKREATALQDLGEALLRFAPADLARAGIPDALCDAIAAMQQMRERGARKRQLQYIGKLMRNIDPEPARAALDRLTSTSTQDKALLHRVERWRERLLEEGDEALAELVEQCAGVDRQHLRNLVRQARQERLSDKPPTSSRALFRYLRELLAADSN